MSEPGTGTVDDTPQGTDTVTTQTVQSETDARPSLPQSGGGDGKSGIITYREITPTTGREGVSL